jgi:hypothetical protein
VPGDSYFSSSALIQANRLREVDMCWPTRSATSLVITVLAAALSAAACSDQKSEAGAVASAGASAPFGIELSQTYLTIENRTGSIVTGGRLEIVPGGVLPPFTAPLSRLEIGEKKPVMFNTFRGNDGTAFRRGVFRVRRLKLTATDFNGKTYEQEVPFE